MALTDLIGKLFKKNEDSASFNFSPDEIDGAYFSVDNTLLGEIENGVADDWVTQQYIVLKMLEEQGAAEIIPNGFIVPSEVIVQLDDYTRSVLPLPDPWEGTVYANIQGKAGRSNFGIDLFVSDPDARKTLSYHVQGPVLRFGESYQYLLSNAQLGIFEAQKKHSESSKDEFDDLLFLHSLQNCQKQNANIKLSHFDKFQIYTPEKIVLEAQVDASGNLILSPQMGQQTSHDDLQKVFGQLDADSAKTLRFDNEIILLNEDKLKAVREILDNRIVPKSRVEEFLRSPTAFLDASMVDLELGFSLRVHGATAFRHAYFGDVDDTGIDWFGKSMTSEKVFPFTDVAKVVKDTEMLKDLETLVSDATRSFADELSFEGKIYDISDDKVIKKTCDSIRKKLEGGAEQGDDSQESDREGDPDKGIETELKEETVVVDIDLNDEILTESSLIIDQKIHDVSRVGELDWANYIRKPYEHQEVGVRWILGLIDIQQSDSLISGGLLADDMGLGKTFMALSAIDHHYKELRAGDHPLKPVLIVAPLSLLENWREEVSKTFSNSPFKDIVILQTDGELGRFKSGSVEIRSTANEDDEFEPKYSLNIGIGHSDRLDMPERLIITTYQTLRDYQFSLCSIPWSTVVFDEAQNIKNPNALQTRAAKGLNADFKLVATGTPVENSLADFWCLMDTAIPGYLNTYQNFRSKYVAPILQAAGDEIDEVRAAIGRELRLTVGAMMLRRTKEDNLKDLPSKTVYVGLEGSEWEYHPMLRRVMSGYQQKVYEGAISSFDDKSDNHVLTTLHRLRNSSLHPRLADEGRLDAPKTNRELRALIGESQKLESLIEALAEIQKKQEKCIIIVVNKKLQMFVSLALARTFNLAPLTVINGDSKAVAKKSSTPTRKTLIAKFEEKKGFNLIVMSPVAAGVGLTIIGANHVVHYERHWNPAKEAQATDRVYRLGQKKGVHVYVPLLHHPEMESFDVNLHRLLTKKSSLKDAVVTPEDVIPMPEGLNGADFFTDEHSIRVKDLSKLSWQQFEALTLEVFSKKYKADSAWLTKEGSDMGADGILVTGDDLILIQAKHTKSGYDGHKAIQEVLGAKPFYTAKLGKEKAHLIFVTNATKLSKRTREVAETCKVEVIDGKELGRLLDKNEVTFSTIMRRLNRNRLVVN